jgi:hypothetical protein|tara:strand:+ start:649 stop:2463 length:1815 start_codon:yes stop_codon:yes gene_type:complete
MAGVNGSVKWGIVPLDFTGSDLAGTFFSSRSNYLKSANSPLRYQIVWSKAALQEDDEPSAAAYSGANGDVVYIKFNIQIQKGDGSFKTIATICKTRDIVNKKYDSETAAFNHRFTIDIQQIIADQLSYSLCPIGKGTWQSTKYGGMNGGAIMQDNVLSNTQSTSGQPISDFNVSLNGTYIRARVKAIPYIINASGQIVEVTDSDDIETSEVVSYINSVHQFEQDKLYLYDYIMQDSSSSSTYQAYKFLSRYENFSADSSEPVKKPIRINEEAEYLNFYIRKADSDDIGGSGDDKVRAMGMYVETFTAGGSTQNQFYVRDFEDNLIVVDAGDDYFAEDQNGMFTQNISPEYINNGANLKTYNSGGSGTIASHWSPYGTSTPITASTVYYRVSLVRFPHDTTEPSRRTSEYRYYSIDREDAKIPYGFVRFHWLNDLGSTDSYTCKRNIAEGYSIGKGIIERNSTDRTWYQQDKKRTGTSPSFSSTTISPTTNYHSDTMRGGDIYKGGREVLNVNAEKTLSVYTEPLNDVDAKWLSKMMLSPNVWIEMDTDATSEGNARNSYLRPSTKEYIPVIITNSDVETVNQERGLVSFNIEYTLSHKVITQRN